MKQFLNKALSRRTTLMSQRESVS